MALARSRRERGIDYWPGFVDALSTLILGIVFLLSVFVVVQFFLSQEVTGKDTALQRLNAQLATLEQDRSRLFTMHFIPRNAGWSEILPKFDSMIHDAQVQNLHIDYSIDQSPQYGLYSVKIRVPVDGAYPNVVNFIKDIENSETFLIISSIDLHGSASSTVSVPGSPNITLALNLETFFYQ